MKFTLYKKYSKDEALIIDFKTNYYSVSLPNNVIITYPLTKIFVYEVYRYFDNHYMSCDAFKKYVINVYPEFTV